LEPPIYQIKDLSYRYDGQTVLRIDDLSIAPASIVGLVGPNGSGKSTLLRLPGCIARPSLGSILFRGQPADPFSANVRFHITLLAQEPYLLKRTVYRNIAYGLNIRKDCKDLGQRIHEALAWVGLPAEDFIRRQWYQLSGGEAQRVVLAARLVLKPKVLLLDEPTANVDVASSLLIKDASVKARDQWGTTLVIASHDREWLDEICDQVFYLFKGRIIGSGRGNVIFGPWFRRADGSYQKTLSDGQGLITPPPTDSQAVALLNPAALTVTARGGSLPSGQWTLGATITRLALGESSDCMMATLRAGNLSLAAKLAADQVCRQSLYPGRPVVISYPPEAIHWISNSTR
jgi:tungstate transport system ATP-binding protein